MTSIAKAELGGLADDAGFQLRLAQMAAFRNLAAALTPLSLKPTDFSVLLLVGSTPGLKQQAVGEALRIQRPNLVSIVDQLEKRGLLVRGVVEGDRRSHALSLTSDGAQLLTRARQVQAAHSKKIEQVLGELDTDNLLEGLKRIADMDLTDVSIEGAVQ